MRHLILLSGKDSLATALIQTEREPDSPYEFIFNDVEAELPETYAWLDEVEAKTGWNVARIGCDLTAKIRFGYNGFLPSGRARYCTREGKIDPLKKYLGEDEATVYFGLRADETRTGFVPLASSNITPCYPLIETGTDLAGVYATLDRHALAPPCFFWPRLRKAVSEKLKPLFPDWEAQLSRAERDLLFAGRSRGNCYFCFFQRQYEYIWLMETHPDLWEQAKSFENVGSNYTWRADYALADLEAPERAATIFGARVRMVCGQIAKKMQLDLFDEPSEEIAAYSCGLLCGK